MTLVDDAVRYAQLGYRVFPCRAGSKRPCTSKGFHDATRDEDLIRAWWLEWPAALIATPDTCTVDIEAPKPSKNGGPDGPDGWLAWRELTAEHGEPDAPTTQTGLYNDIRGAQLHFAFRDDVKTGVFAEGIEVRARGSYVLLPPSAHPTGVNYEGELPPIDELPELPQWIADLRHGRKPGQARSTAQPLQAEKLPPVIRDGSWHTTMVSAAGTLRRRGFSEQAATAALIAENGEKYNGTIPADSDTEIAELVADVYERYDAVETIKVERAYTGAARTSESSGAQVSKLSDAGLEEAVFVERPLLQVALTLLAGRPGVGKGALCAYWVARCTNGELYGRPLNVLWLSSEDDAAIDLGPRVEAAGGNRERVYLIPHTFQLPGDIDWLRETVETIGDVGLVIIDPLGNHTGAANTDRDSDVRVALMPLAVLANELRLPLIGVRHISTKDVSGGALRKVLGSTAWIGVPRVVLVAAQDTSDPAILHVHPIKGNRVPAREGGREFRLEGRLLPGFKESVVFVVPAGASDVDIDAMLAGGKTETGSKRARALILETLRDAPGQRMESDHLDALVADASGVAAKTVQNLRSELRNKGLIRSVPERDSLGEVERWLVALTHAAESPSDENQDPSRARGNKQRSGSS